MLSTKLMHRHDLLFRVSAFAVLAAGLGRAADEAAYKAHVAESLDRVQRTINAGPYRSSWESLQKYEVPQWYADAKFGIFIHWGVYSVPAFGSEWYPRQMYQNDSREFKHHIATYGPQSKFGYKDFIPNFKAQKFDANSWANLFEKAGAKFVVPVAEHHDGFPMYDCTFTDWSAAKMGPKRDIVGELAVAVRKHNMHLGASSHRAEHYWFFDGGRKFDSDVQDPKYAGLYGPAHPEKTPDGKSNSQPDAAYMDDWLVRTAEIVDKYKPDLIWFDWWIEQPVFQPYLQKFAAFYYNRGAEWKRGGVAINYKNTSFPDKAAVLDIERGKLDAMRKYLWQTDTSVGLKSWGYIEGEKFRDPDGLIDDLIDIVSKNGVLLLNIGPRPDGTIPEEAQKVLLAMGRWLRANGEAIYGTRPWKVYGEGPTEVLTGGFTDAKSKPFTAEDIRFTQKGNALYAITLDWPAKPVVIKSLGSNAHVTDQKIGSIRLIGSDEKLKWTQGAGSLTIEPPSKKTGEFAFVFKIDLT
jgi:alpha-L-fucosidase